MKNLLMIALVFVASFTANAQIETPQPSPEAKIEQKVGLTDLTLEFSRPSMRGRAIFGDLVPYGEMWRTGANKNTIITFSDDVKIGGKEVKAGSYAIFTKPNKSSWDIVFYTDTNNWGTPKAWDESKVAAKVTTDVMNMPMKMETFTMLFDDLTNNSAVLGILWEDVFVGVTIEVPTAAKVKANINKVMNGPGAADYYAAARYNLESNGDIKQAVVWIDKAIDMSKDDPKFWMLRQQSLIHAKAGNKKEAIKAAKASLKLAEEADNAGYVKMNKEFLKEWE
ncbi:DUF2911 domain-containing protein [Lacinutrix venerupis]|uniref:Dihydrolipoamide dehydrogenase n=1 Tax=Lacinutrix venerupis TaxID=1486034 RepID=A0AAC9PWY0_9FLAO|nr:DUF2911 domain-containing protein [Lacinutrix venerupis]APY00203.1 dihydrolipoamide dehydrogenase [Lacinutrix venerupis]